MTESAIPKFSSNDPRLWFYRAYVVRIIDGDTAVLFVDRGMHEFMVMKARLAGIDAPELRPRRGTKESKAAEKILAAKAADRLSELIEGKEVMIRTHKTGKFGRWLAEIFLPEDPNVTANQLLLDEGLAVTYGTPRPWRPDE